VNGKIKRARNNRRGERGPIVLARETKDEIGGPGHGRGGFEADFKSLERGTDFMLQGRHFHVEKGAGIAALNVRAIEMNPRGRIAGRLAAGVGFRRGPGPCPRTGRQSPIENFNVRIGIKMPDRISIDGYRTQLFLLKVQLFFVQGHDLAAEPVPVAQLDRRRCGGPARSGIEGQPDSRDVSGLKFQLLPRRLAAAERT